MELAGKNRGEGQASPAASFEEAAGRPRRRGLRGLARGRAWLLTVLLGLLASVFIVFLTTTGLDGPRAVRGAYVGLKRFVQRVEEDHPNALWSVVHEVCMRNQRAIGRPFPCIEVNLDAGYAVLKDPERRTQLLLVPTTRISGAEAPSLIQPGARNYWQDAWSTKPVFEKFASGPVPRQDLALAVNSLFSRTQEQLHIHIDCVRPEVREFVRINEGTITATWRPLRRKLLGFSYWARWVDGPDLAASNPFVLLGRDRRMRATMGMQALAVVGAVRANGQPGFVLFSRPESEASIGFPSGEVLLDHRCNVLASGSGT